MTGKIRNCNRLLSLSLGPLLSIAFVAAAPAEEFPDVDIVVAGNLGITSQSQELERPFWTSTIPEKTNGRFNVRFRPWNEMGLDGSEVIRMVRRGTLQAGTTQMGFGAGDSPLVDGTDLAGLSPDIDTFSRVTEAFTPVLHEHYEHHEDVKVLGLWSFQAQVLFCREAMDSLEDLQGRRVRVSGASQADFVEHFGGSGASMAWGEVQQALQLGVLDCAITGSVGGYTGNWHEAATHIHPLPINWGSSVMVVNKDFWESLPEHAQEFLQAEVDALSEDIWQLNREENEWGIACNTDGPCPAGDPAGLQLVEITERELELRREALNETVLPNWADRCGPECAEAWNETVGDIVELRVPVNQ